MKEKYYPIVYQKYCLEFKEKICPIIISNHITGITIFY